MRNIARDRTPLAAPVLVASLQHHFNTFQYDSNQTPLQVTRAKISVMAVIVNKTLAGLSHRRLAT